jgi:preprotein translocase subunit SecG
VVTGGFGPAGHDPRSGRVSCSRPSGATAPVGTPATGTAAGRNESMSVLETVLTILLIVCSLLIVALVLMHRGKGGGLSDMFGGGFTSSYGGSSVAERNLDRITVGVGIVWVAIVIALGLLNVSS